MFKGTEVVLINNEWRTKGITLVLAIIVGGLLGALTAVASPIYIVGGLVGLGIGVALLMNTQIGLLTFVGVATLLPFGVVPVPLGGVKLTFVDAVLSALLLVWLVRLLTRVRTRLEFTRLGLPVLVFIFLAFTSFVIGTSYYTSPEATRLFLKLINSVIFFFTVVNCVWSRRQLHQIVMALILGGAASAAVVIVLNFMPAALATHVLLSLRPLGYYQSGEDVLRYIADTNTLRAISTSVDPNVLGALLMLCLTLAVSQLLSPKPVIGKKWLLPLSALIAVCLLLTLSRGSWIGFMVAMLFIATMKYRRLWLLFAIIAVILYFGIMPTDVPFLSHLVSGLEARDKAAAMRLGEYKDAIQLISRYPWFGVGFGNPPSADLYVGVSSVYLLIAEQMGLIGLGTFLLLLGFLFIEVLKKLGRIADPQLQSIVLGLVATLVAALVAGVFDHHYFDIRFPHVAAIVWLVVGLIFVGLRLSETTEHA